MKRERLLPKEEKYVSDVELISEDKFWVCVEEGRKEGGREGNTRLKREGRREGNMRLKREGGKGRKGG